MPFDGLFLSRIVNEIQFLKSGRISKINQISDYEFLFLIRVNAKNEKLLLSLHPENCRIQLTYKEYNTPYEPTNMCMFMRKHFMGGIIKDISQYKNDRIVTFTILTTTEIGDKVPKSIVVEIMGRRSNMIICEENRILEGFRHNSPFEKGRTIVNGAIYNYPETEKILLADFDFAHSIEPTDIKNCMGISKKALEVLINNYTLSTYTRFLNDQNPLLFVGDDDFYFTELYPESKSFLSFSELLDEYFYERDNIDRIKQKSNNMSLFITKRIEHLINKIEKLSLDLKNAINNEEYKIKGELLLTNAHHLTKSSKVIVDNYYTGEKLEISLDPLKSPMENANVYFKKYQKAKKAIEHLTIQINDSRNELEYFDLLLLQISNASINDALEIKEELENYGYIKKKNKLKKKNKTPQIASYKIDDAIIYVGKNNLQNAYLTHKFANQNDLWFHVKDSASSHVLLVGEETEETIRFAANQAALNSKYKNSSSVPVDYTKIRYVKKIAGKKGCFVSYTNQKTIYIDPQKKE